ncbi:hypothetical protein DV735_g4623, partial [Chaetothyriales sp. CBS 134920]
MGSFGELNDYGHAMKALFLFDNKYTNLNHGSFGTYPLPVRNALRGYQKLAEAAPDKFIRYQSRQLLDNARERIAKVVHAPVDECVFVTNATSGMNTVLRNLVYQDKDCILYFDTIYSGIEKTLYSIQETNPQLSLRKVGAGQDYGYVLPCTHPDILNAFSQTISRILYDGYTPKVAIFDTIVSVPGVRFPFERLTRMCKEYGILSVIDGAHGVGHIPLNLSQLDADFFVSNCHKWLYTPRGCALLHVPKRNQHLIRTTYPTSHGYVPLPGIAGPRQLLPPTTKSAFVTLFQDIATSDSSPFYCVPAALNFRQNLCKGGDDGIYEYIRDIAQRGADLLALVLGTEVMDELDEGKGLKTMGSTEANDRRETKNWTGSLRDCAMANVLLPICIAGASTVGSIAAGPGGAGSAGGLSPLYGQGRKSSYGFSSPLLGGGTSKVSGSSTPGRLDGPPSPWLKGGEVNSSPMGSPSIGTGTTTGPIVVRKEDVGKHCAWMEKTLVEEFNTFVIIYEYNGKMWTRVSGQVYVELKDFEWLGGVLKELCERVRLGESLRQDAEWDGGPLSKSTTPSGSTIDLELLGRTVSDVRLADQATQKYQEVSRIR